MRSGWTKTMRGRGVRDDAHQDTQQPDAMGPPPAEGADRSEHDFAGELRRRREAAGFSQTELANRVGYSREYVSRAERPTKGLASAELVRVIDDALHARGELVALRAAAHDGRLTRRRPGPETAAAGARAARPDGTDADLDQVRQALNEAIAGGDRAGHADADVWDRVVLQFGVSAKDRSPGDLLGEIVADLTDLSESLSACRSAFAMRRMTRSAARLAGLMCLTLVKLDEPAAAQRWARTAHGAAVEVDDPDTTSWVLAQEAYGHFYGGDLHRAVAVADLAQASARQPCVGSALAAALEARAQAALGRATATRAAVAVAETTLAALPVADGLASAFGYDEAQLRFHTSNALTHLGDVPGAWAAQDQALELIGDHDFMDRALTQLDRAVCLRHDGDPSAAAAHAVATLSALEPSQRTGIITARARALLPDEKGKARHVSAPVRELRDLIGLTTDGGSTH